MNEDEEVVQKVVCTGVVMTASSQSLDLSCIGMTCIWIDSLITERQFQLLDSDLVSQHSNFQQLIFNLEVGMEA